MSLINTITVADLADQENVLKMISEIQNHRAIFSLVQNGVEVAHVIPTRANNGTVSEELTAQRWAALKSIEKTSQRIAELWKSEETAAEAVSNDRRYIEHGSR